MGNRMMHPFIPLAHGALGPYDELLPLLVFVIFLLMVAVAWFTGRKPTAPPVPPTNPTDQPKATPEAKTADHHRLD